MLTEITQQASLLLGAQKDIDALAAKQSALLLIISDSHGNADVVRSILEYFGSKADALCFCGDGIQDVLTAIETAAADERLARCIPPVVALVRGNGDAGIYHLYDKVSIPKDLQLTVAGRRIFMTHGHNYEVYYSSRMLYDAAQEAQASLLLFGHTHVANVQQKDGVLLLNPGSCSRPRGGQPHTLALATVGAAIDYSYYQLVPTGENTLQFRPFQPPTTEVSLLW